MSEPIDEQRDFWDAEAASFDDEPDHGLRDPATRTAWARLLRPGGRLLLVEGRRHTGGGLTSSETVRLTEASFADVHLQPLPDPVYWDRPITDERYLVTATCLE